MIELLYSIYIYIVNYISTIHPIAWMLSGGFSTSKFIEKPHLLCLEEPAKQKPHLPRPKMDVWYGKTVAMAVVDFTTDISTATALFRHFFLQHLVMASVSQAISLGLRNCMAYTPK